MNTIELGKQANRYASMQTDDDHIWHVIRDERFAHLVRAAVLEEAAGVAEANAEDEPYGHAKFRCVNIAAAIRALKDGKP